MGLGRIKYSTNVALLTYGINLNVDYDDFHDVTMLVMSLEAIVELAKYLMSNQPL